MSLISIVGVPQLLTTASLPLSHFFFLPLGHDSSQPWPSLSGQNMYFQICIVHIFPQTIFINFYFVPFPIIILQYGNTISTYTWISHNFLVVSLSSIKLHDFWHAPVEHQKTCKICPWTNHPSTIPQLHFWAHNPRNIHLFSSWTVCQIKLQLIPWNRTNRFFRQLHLFGLRWQINFYCYIFPFSNSSWLQLTSKHRSSCILVALLIEVL